MIFDCGRVKSAMDLESEDLGLDATYVILDKPVNFPGFLLFHLSEGKGKLIAASQDCWEDPVR